MRPQFPSAVRALLLLLIDAGQLSAQSIAAEKRTERLLARVKQACYDNAANLRSAAGEGFVRHSLFKADQESPTTLIDADVQLFYDAPKFHVRLQYAIRLQEVLGATGGEEGRKWIDSSLREQVVIFDGDQVYSVEFSRDGSCHGDIYFGFNRQRVMRSAGLPVENPAQLWSEALDLERSDLQDAYTTELSDGGFLALLTKETYRLKFYFLGDFGYDLRRVSSYRTNEEMPFRDCLLYWRESQGIHYVNRYVTRVEEPSADSAANRRQLEIEFKTFKPNVPIDARLFSIYSVAMPQGTQFEDHRTSLDGKPLLLEFDGTELIASE